MTQAFEEFERLVRKLTDEELSKQLEQDNHAPFEDYPNKTKVILAKEVARRLGWLRRDAEDYVATLDAVREALGQEETHYLCIPDDVRIAIKALEWYAVKGSPIDSNLAVGSLRARLSLAVIRGNAEHEKCQVCGKKLVALKDELPDVPAIFCAECGGGCSALPAEEVMHTP